MNTIPAEILKARSAEQLIKMLNNLKLSIFDMTLALRTLAFLTKENEKIQKDQVIKIKNQVLGNFDKLNLRDISNILFYLKRFKDDNDLKFVLEDSHHKKIAKMMEHKYYSISKIIQIYYTLNWLKYDCFKYDFIITDLLRNENSPVFFVDIKIIFICILNKTSFINTEIAKASFQRLESMILTPAMLGDVIGILNLLFKVQIKMIAMVPKELEAKIDNFLGSSVLSDQNTLTVLESFESLRTPSRILNSLVYRLISDLEKNLQSTNFNPQEVDFLKNFPIIPLLGVWEIIEGIEDHHKKTLLTLCSWIINTATEYNEYILSIISIIYKLTDSFEFSTHNIIKAQYHPLSLINLLKSLSYFKTAEKTAKKLLVSYFKTHLASKQKNPTFMENYLNLSLDMKCNLIKSINLFREPERFKILVEVENQIVNLICEDVQKAEDIESVFNNFQGDPDFIAKIKPAIIIGMEKAIKFELDVSRALKIFVSCYRNDDYWYYYTDKLIPKLDQNSFSKYLNTSYITAKNLPGLKHCYQKLSEKSYKDILTFIFILFEESLRIK